MLTTAIGSFESRRTIHNISLTTHLVLGVEGSFSTAARFVAYPRKLLTRTTHFIHRVLTADWRQ